MRVTTARTWVTAGLVAGSIAIAAPAARAQEGDDPGSRPGWTAGPHTGTLGDQARIEIPEGYYFLDKAATHALLRASENVPSGDELGAVVFASDDGHSWFALFSFSNDGYVDDSDRDAIDADALLAGMKRGTEADNKERQKHGWAPFHLEGWHKKPYYDPATNDLTWAIKGASPGDTPTINHSVRLLGRRGVMSVQLVAGEDGIDAMTGQFDELLTGFSYNPGQRYAEFRKGDKMAGYGLAALIGGGAAAAAVKSGFLSKAWKAIVALVVAAAAGLKKILGGRSRDESASVQPPPVPQ